MQSIVEKEGDETDRFNDEHARSFLLVDPSSAYSDLRVIASEDLDESWHDALARSGLDADVGIEVYARRMGLTKARPQVDIVVDPAYDHYDPLIGAQATKAAMDEDIFRQAVNYTGYHNSALAANYAVGAQILRDKLHRVPVDKHDDYNLRSDVLERFMHLATKDVIDDYDGDYLQRLLKSEMVEFRPGTSPSLGVQYIPAQFRVARVAAAYHDQTGYFGGYPCLPSGRYNPSFAGTGKEGDSRALCFVDATDQDTYAWYQKQLADQIEGIKRYPDNIKESGLVKLLRPIAIISEAAGIGSFIHFSTGLRAWGKGMIRPRPVKNIYQKINTRMCKA
ncbi:MAG: hypothetical protein GAK28_01173 [Luteibacter sp.]|uniref:hypothetical protein n=1 Tax=Luteibacter sp. TaxID=1886636 RepID=UPI001380C0EC|nr:hypothetical protein [Luteibacter sp.]KAF1008194.1 MAG: hypothetical protein GAK28_01173 [Luteibacter sp.]